VSPVVSLVEGKAGFVKPTGTGTGSIVIEIDATSPGVTTNSGALPKTPFGAVAVIVATPSETPVAFPETGSTVAIELGSADHVRSGDTG
jgi:hypothetical protein